MRFPIQEFSTTFTDLDLNTDGHVDQADLAIFVNCLTGPGVPYQLPAFPGQCTLATGPDGTIPADHDKDHDVDQEDFGVLQRCLGQTVSGD